MAGAVLKVLDISVIVAALLAFVAITNEALREARNSPEEALERCWGSIRSELESPERASLNEELSRASPRQRRRNDPTLWRVHLVVDERDEKGAVIREYYRCEIEHDPGSDSWRRIAAATIPE